MTKKTKERFWAKVQKGPRCWLWKAGKNNKGYGNFWVGGKCCKSHRLSYEMKHGSILNGMYVCHHCDTPACVNPDHLFVGTQKDNVIDCMNKGRNNKGKKIGSCNVGSLHPRAKLTEEQVKDILTDTRLHREIAKDYGIDKSIISKIKSKNIWKHVKE
jgi:hypothetical protein